MAVNADPVADAMTIVARTYGFTPEALHDYLINRRTVDAVMAAIDLTILRGHLNARSQIADARLAYCEPDVPGDEPELLRRIAITRPAHEAEAIYARYGRPRRNAPSTQVGGEAK